MDTGGGLDERLSCDFTMLTLSKNTTLSPLLLSGGFAVLNVVIYLVIAQLAFDAVFSFDYLFWVIGVLVTAFPLGLIMYQAIKANWAWWSVALACVISIAISFMHFWMFIVATSGF